MISNKAGNQTTDKNHPVTDMQRKLSINASLAHKIGRKNKLSAGVLTDLIQYDLSGQNLYPVNRSTQNATGSTLLVQLCGQWKHRFNEQLTLNTGLSVLRLALNGSTAVEPRLGMSYQLTPTSFVSVAYGLHSMMQPILTYVYQTRQSDGSYVLTNKNLNFTRSHHAVIGYDQMLTESLRLKLETYYQWLFDAPVDQTPSYFSMLTTGTDFGPANRGNLVNAGTGRNYGLELTLEKFFSDNYYFLATASLFDAKYTGSDGIERNTRSIISMSSMY